MAENTELNFDWSKAVCWPTGETPQIIKTDSYTPTVGMLKREEELPVDQLGRSDTARFLTGLAHHKKNGYVLNLNCPWGTGKTWFLKRWYLTLKTQHPVVYIDAWKYDHNDSPLLIILKQIINELEKQSPQAAKGFAEQIKSSKLFATLKVLGPEFIKVALRIDTEQLIEKAELAFEKSHIDDLASKATTFLLDNIDKETQAVEELKEAIATLLDGIVGSTAKPKLTYPLFIFVDELDRCRPTFAIEMLEAIKHVFGIPQIFFVIATDSEQLQHSINAVYGEKFGSYNYLKRFFDASFQLETPEPQSFILAQSEFSDIFEFYSSYNDLYDIQDKNKLAEVFATICKAFSVELRTIKQWLGRLQICCLLSAEQMKKLPFWGLVFVSLLKAKDVAIYSLINSDLSTYGHISKETNATLSIQLKNFKQDVSIDRDKYRPRFRIEEFTCTEHVRSWLLNVLLVLYKTTKDQEPNSLEGNVKFADFKAYYYKKLSQPNGSLLHHVNRLLEFTEQLQLD